MFNGVAHFQRERRPNVRVEVSKNNMFRRQTDVPEEPRDFSSRVLAHVPHETESPEFFVLDVQVRADVTTGVVPKQCPDPDETSVVRRREKQPPAGFQHPS